jgi:hypothetical protein
MRKKLLTLLIGAAMITATGTVFAHDSRHDEDHKTLTIAVFGDAPYGLNNSDTAQFIATPAFINTINADKDVSLVFHAGDIHSGKQTCSYSYDKSIYDMWTAFKSPLIYTPGDNEWTDCHKSKEGGLDPIANLEYIREIFFANPGNALAVDKELISQANAFDAAYPTDAEYVENVMWAQDGVVFVTVNIPGGSNNNEDNWYGASRSEAQTKEILKRTSASLRWLDKGFAYADAQHARAVVLMVQADMWDLDGTPQANLHIANYRQYIDTIAMHTEHFGKPVLLINGDSHGYRSDNPLVKGSTCVAESGATEVACVDDAYANQPFGYNVRNFHRIVVHGSTAPMEWLKLQVKTGESERRSGPNTFGPFSWQRKVQALP